MKRRKKSNAQNKKDKKTYKDTQRRVVVQGKTTRNNEVRSAA